MTIYVFSKVKRAKAQGGSMLEILFDFISLISLLIIVGNYYYQQRINKKLSEIIKWYDEITRDCLDLLKMKRS